MIDSGDGAGIMASMPDKFFRKEAKKLGIDPERIAEIARQLGVARRPVALVSNIYAAQALSRLDGQPARSPADASPTPSRMPAHGLGPMWFAIPSSSGTCTPYSLPVSRRTCV